MNDDLAQLLQHLSCAIARIDGGGRVLFANAAACRMLRLSVGDTVADSPVEETIVWLRERLLAPPVSVPAVAADGQPLRLRVLRSVEGPQDPAVAPGACWLIAEPDAAGLPTPASARELVDALARLQSPAPPHHAAPRRGRVQRVPLMPLLMQVLEDVAPAAARAHLDLAWQSDGEDSPIVYGSLERLSLVLREVANHALDLTARGGEVVFVLQHQGPDAVLRVQARPLCAAWDRAGSLGWALLRCLAECLGGTLDVDLSSDPGVLVLRLPMGAPPARDHRLALQQMRRFIEERDALRARRRHRDSSSALTTGETCL